MGCGASSSKYHTDTAKDDCLPGITFNVDNPGKVDDFYTVGKQIGTGSYSYVSEVTSKTSGDKFAMQAIAKSNVKSASRLDKEINILKMMNHKHICKLYETFEDHRNVYLVFELCRGGDLFDRILKTGRLFEFEGAIIMQSLFEAIDHMHSHCVCHLDIKPENLLFSSKEAISQTKDATELKLIDFDNACSYEAGKRVDVNTGPPYFLDPDRPATNVAGEEVRQGEVAKHKAASRMLHARSVKAYYTAPEVVWSRRGCTQAVDLWSAGAIMYVMLSGYPPFYGETDADVLDKAQREELVFEAYQWKTVTEEAQKLCSFLLQKDAKKRWSAAQALDSSWIRNKAVYTDRPPIDTAVVKNLQTFWSHNGLKKAALQFLASQLEESDIKSLTDTFAALDSNGDGTLSKAELKLGMNHVKINEVSPDFQAILAGVSSSDAGRIDYKDFLAATINRRKYLTEEALWEVFRAFDSDNSGNLSKDELLEAASNGKVKGFTGQDLPKLLESIDENGDGKINFREFLDMMQEHVK